MLYKKDFEITGGDKMETFLGMAVEQKSKSINIHLDNYIKDVLNDNSAYIKNRCDLRRYRYLRV